MVQLSTANNCNLCKRFADNLLRLCKMPKISRFFPGRILLGKSNHMPQRLSGLQ